MICSRYLNVCRYNKIQSVFDHCVMIVMTSLDKAIIASYEKSGNRFELYVDPDSAQIYKEGKKPDLKNILVSEEVYIDARKGERAKSDQVQKMFGTTDIMKILEFVLKNGEIHLTTDQRRKKVEEMRKKIVAVLVRESIDPRTNAPHTQLRIENAMDQIKIKIDPFLDPREQVTDIIKELRPILPLKFEKIRIAVKVSAAYAQKCYGVLKNYGLTKEEWASDGSLIAVVELFGGLQGEFYDRLNKLTGGSVETKLLNS